jgi:hypothetical protein
MDSVPVQQPQPAFQVERKTLDLSLLDGNPLNPNRMPADKFAKLVRHVRETGWFPAVVVRQAGEPGRYEIVDGHHRVKVALELGWTAVPVEDLGPIPRERARLLLATLNTLKGRHDRGKHRTLLDMIMRDADGDAAAVAEYVVETETEVLEIVCGETQQDPEVLDHHAAKCQPVTYMLDGQSETVIAGAVRMKIGNDRWRRMNGLDKELAAGRALGEICAAWINSSDWQ